MRPVPGLGPDADNSGIQSLAVRHSRTIGQIKAGLVVGTGKPVPIALMPSRGKIWRRERFHLWPGRLTCPASKRFNCHQSRNPENPHSPWGADAGGEPAPAWGMEGVRRGSGRRPRKSIRESRCAEDSRRTASRQSRRARNPCCTPRAPRARQRGDHAGAPNFGRGVYREKRFNCKRDSNGAARQTGLRTTPLEGGS